jgi:hypothetical protein
MIVVPLILVAMLGAGAYLFMTAFHTKAPGPASDLQSQIEALKAKQGEMMKQGGLNSGISDTNTLDPDSTEAKAQRELKRLREKAGISAPPPTDANGNVHLRGGGTLTREEWEKAQNSIKSSPVYHAP